MSLGQESNVGAWISEKAEQDSKIKGKMLWYLLKKYKEAANITECD